jgi:hypothetical protein
VIVDVEATPARTYDEVAATKTMLDCTEACFDLKPKRLAADTAYGTGKFLGWLVKEKRIAPHIRSGSAPSPRMTNSLLRISAGTADAAPTPVPTASMKALGLSVIYIDARHAKVVLKMQINKSDRNDAAGVVRIMQTGWFKEVRLKGLRQPCRARAAGEPCHARQDQTRSREPDARSLED